MQLVDNIKLSASKFLDARQYWESLSKLKENTDVIMPKGFQVYCAAENKWYHLDCTDASDPSTYEWKLNAASANTFNGEDFSVGSQNEVSLLPVRRIYNGTKADWDSLSVAEKTQYGATAFTDDEGGGSCPGFPNYANRITIPVGTTSWTATEDCYVIITQIFTQGAVEIKIDNVVVGVSDTSAGFTVNSFSGYLKKGQTISYEYLAYGGFAKIFPLL